MLSWLFGVIWYRDKIWDLHSWKKFSIKNWELWNNTTAIVGFFFYTENFTTKVDFMIIYPLVKKIEFSQALGFPQTKWKKKSPTSELAITSSYRYTVILTIKVKFWQKWEIGEKLCNFQIFLSQNLNKYTGRKIIRIWGWFLNM